MTYLSNHVLLLSPFSNESLSRYPHETGIFALLVTALIFLYSMRVFWGLSRMSDLSGTYSADYSVFNPRGELAIAEAVRTQVFLSYLRIREVNYLLVIDRGRTILAGLASIKEEYRYG
jgi:hypothetical protein